jgi:xylulose-5-phosphate/fructose-6-phosphate phosphoketolase
VPIPATGRGPPGCGTASPTCPRTPSRYAPRHTDKPIIFAYHGYPLLIHRLTYRRTNHHNLHVRGYKEEGTTTTPFDMVVLNDLDRLHLGADVIDRVPALGHSCGVRAAGDPRQVDRAQAVHREVWRGHAGDS